MEEPASQQISANHPEEDVPKTAAKTAGRIIKFSRDLGDSVTDYYPLIVASSGPVKDRNVITWLKENLSETAPAPGGQGEEHAAEQLDDILAHTNLGAPELARIGIALYQRQYPALEHPTHANALEAAAGLRFMLKAEATAISNLAVLPNGGADGANSIAVLKSLIDPLIHETRWDVLLNVFAVLIPWEPEGSDARYYDRWKYADMFFQCQRFDESLTAIDALIADVRNGTYATANMKDLSQLRWNICARSGKAEECLVFLREAADHPAKPSDSERISVILIRALAQMGYVDEARERFSRWQNLQDPNSGSAGIDALKQDIALAAWTKANRDVPSQ
ncbi:MAG: hypothetical protein M3O30_08225 [Planctomycetota bacterium]|nr:hypothetical protein [Planctomycetota bacterium]